MATPLRKSPFYRASYFVEYDLPPDADDDVSRIIAMINDDIAFTREVKKTRELKNPMVAQYNHVLAGEEPPEEWDWNNTKPSVRRRIVKGMANKGVVAILQKRRFLRNIGDIETKDERLRALKECNEQLVHAWTLIDVFHSVDESLSGLRELVNDSYVLDPNLSIIVQKNVLIPNE